MVFVQWEVPFGRRTRPKNCFILTGKIYKNKTVALTRFKNRTNQELETAASGCEQSLRPETSPKRKEARALSGLSLSFLSSVVQPLHYSIWVYMEAGFGRSLFQTGRMLTLTHHPIWLEDISVQIYNQTHRLLSPLSHKTTMVQLLKSGSTCSWTLSTPMVQFTSTSHYTLSATKSSPAR